MKTVVQKAKHIVILVAGFSLGVSAFAHGQEITSVRSESRTASAPEASLSSDCAVASAELSSEKIFQKDFTHNRRTDRKKRRAEKLSKAGYNYLFSAGKDQDDQAHWKGPGRYKKANGIFYA